MASNPIRAVVQEDTLDGEITLYVIDASLYGAGIHRLVGGDEGDTAHAVTFDGQVYGAWPVKGEGYGAGTDGSTSRPTLTIANVSGIFTPLVLNNNDLKGATITRIRTYRRYLDDGSDPDPTQTLPYDVYRVNKLVAMTATEIQWELVSFLDQQDVYLPGRQAIRDYCHLIYRVPDGAGGFIYTNATCPYVGTAYFTATGASTTAANDSCGKKLMFCKDRFGEHAELPFGGFAGISRYRVDG